MRLSTSSLRCSGTLCLLAIQSIAIAAQSMPPAGPNVHPFAQVKPYRPVASLAGTIAIVGSDELEKLTQLWMGDFKTLYPGVGFTLEAKSSLSVAPALAEGRSQLGPLGREFLQSEEALFAQKRGHKSLDIRVAAGAYAVRGRTHEVAFLVNQSNPLARIDFQQLDAIYSTTRRQGYPTDILTWGQLGVGGAWASKPIHLWGLQFADGVTHLIQEKVLLGGDYKATIQEKRPTPALSAIDAIVNEVAADPYALGYGGLGYIQGKNVKALALATSPRGPYYKGTYDEVLYHRYPLSRFIYIHLDRKPGKAIDPKVREFVRFVLSAQGQKDVIAEGSYLPLTPDVIRQEMEKLD